MFFFFDFKKKSIYEGWGKERGLGEKKTCQPQRDVSFSPPLQACQYLTERGSVLELDQSPVPCAAKSDI